VAEYVLSKFKVVATAPVYNTHKSGKMVFVVEAKYNYGNPVKGTVSVTALNENFLIKTLPIDGKTIIELDLKDLGITETSDTVRSFNITVLEELSGKLIICF
jgi:hypothetical protein